MPPRRRTTAAPSGPASPPGLPPGLDDGAVEDLRRRLADGEKPRVVLLSGSAGLPAGTRGTVVRVGDPAVEGPEHVTVRMGDDDLPFAPAELTVARRGTSKLVEEAAAAPPRSRRGARAARTGAPGTATPRSRTSTPSATPSGSPVPAPPPRGPTRRTRRAGDDGATPVTPATPESAAPPSTAADSAATTATTAVRAARRSRATRPDAAADAPVPPAATTEPAVASRSGATVAVERADAGRGRRGRATATGAPAPVTVTLRFADGAWSVEVERGGKRVGRRRPLSAAAVKEAAKALGDEGVSALVAETLEAHRGEVEARAEALRAELAAVEAALRELRG